MSKKININGQEFQVIRSKTAPTLYLSWYAGRTVYDCYERPSTSKVSIYNAWLKWAMEAGVQEFGVSGYNGYQFTLQGMIEIDGNTYVLHISKSSNKAYMITD